MSNAPDWTKIAGPLVQAGGVILGGLIGGPAGAVVGPAIGAVLSQALGVPNAPEDVSAALGQPVAGPIVQTIEANQSAGFKSIEAAYLADVQSARDQTLALNKAGSGIAWSAPVISVIIVFGFFAMLTVMATRTVATNELTMLMMGTLTAAFTQVVNYWLGSSRGSADKSAQLAAIATKKQA